MKEFSKLPLSLHTHNLSRQTCKKGQPGVCKVLYAAQSAVIAAIQTQWAPWNAGDWAQKHRWGRPAVFPADLWGKRAGWWSHSWWGEGQASGLTADLWGGGRWSSQLTSGGGGQASDAHSWPLGVGQARGLTPDTCMNPNLAQTTLMFLEIDSRAQTGTREETLRSGNRQMSQLGWMATELG